MPSLSKSYTHLHHSDQITQYYMKVVWLRWNEKLFKLVSIIAQIISFHNHTSRHSTNNRDNAPQADEKANRHIYAIEANNIPVFGIDIEDVFIVRHCISKETLFIFILGSWKDAADRKNFLQTNASNILGKRELSCEL